MDGEVSKKETAVKVVEAAIQHFGRIDLLVNNAGIFIPKAFTDYTEEDYNLVMNTNVASFFFMTRQVVPQMKKQNSGHVVNISAVLADQPSRSRARGFSPCFRSRPCRLLVKRWRWSTRRITSGSTRCPPATSTRPCTPRMIMRRWRSFIPWVGWPRFLTSSTQCSISRTPRS